MQTEFGLQVRLPTFHTLPLSPLDREMLNIGKIALAFALLIAFAAIGIGCAFNPDWGMKHFGRSLTGGGELRRDGNRIQMSAAGVIFAGFALYLIYTLICP